MSEKMTMEEVEGYFRLAVPLMKKNGIPITPNNYAVWYRHVSGADANLSRAIDDILGRGEAFTEETNDALYRQYCAESDESTLKKLREALRQILQTIMRQMSNLTGKVEDYESFATHSVGMLAESSSSNEVKQIVGGLIEETKAIGTFGKTIQNELQETTQELEVLKQDLKQVKLEALTDFLTGLPNRKAFDEALSARIGNAESETSTLCLLFIDIDHFKNFNDQHGHLIGDQVLRFVAKAIKEMVRGSDYPARFGGEEFAVILPQTALAGAIVVAESIRHFFEKKRLKEVVTSKSLGILTVSIGVASYRQGETSEQLIGRSDQALYLAKNTGRNRVVTDADLSHDQRSGHMGSRIAMDHDG